MWRIPKVKPCLHVCKRAFSFSLDFLPQAQVTLIHLQCSTRYCYWAFTLRVDNACINVNVNEIYGHLELFVAIPCHFR